MKNAPVSKLHNYGEIIEQVKSGEPVNLTKNGEDYMVIMTIDDYRGYLEAETQRKEEKEREIVMTKLASELEKGRLSYEKDGGLTQEEVRERLGL